MRIFNLLFIYILKFFISFLKYLFIIQLRHCQYPQSNPKKRFRSYLRAYKEKDYQAIPSTRLKHQSRYQPHPNQFRRCYFQLKNWGNIGPTASLTTNHSTSTNIQTTRPL